MEGRISERSYTGANRRVTNVLFVRALDARGSAAIMAVCARCAHIQVCTCFAVALCRTAQVAFCELVAHEDTNDQSPPRQAAKWALLDELPKLVQAAEDLLASSNAPPARRAQWQEAIDGIKATHARHELNMAAQDMRSSLHSRLKASVAGVLALAAERGHPMPDLQEVLRQIDSELREEELTRRVRAAFDDGAHSPQDYVAWSETLADQQSVLRLLPADLPGAATVRQRAAISAKTAW